MSNEEILFDTAREKILDVMESLSKIESKTPVALVAMLVPILHFAYDYAPSDQAVEQLIRIANEWGKEMSEECKNEQQK